MKQQLSAAYFLELYLDTAGHHVRIDLHGKTITAVFKPWASWHIDTVQVKVADNIIQFQEPGGQVVGVKSFPLATELPGGMENE